MRRAKRKQASARTALRSCLPYLRKEFYRRFACCIPPWYPIVMPRSPAHLFWADDDGVAHNVYVKAYMSPTRDYPQEPWILRVRIDGPKRAVTPSTVPRQLGLPAHGDDFWKCYKTKELSVLPEELLDFTEWAASWALLETMEAVPINPPLPVLARSGRYVWSTAARKKCKRFERSIRNR